MFKNDKENINTFRKKINYSIRQKVEKIFLETRNMAINTK